MIYKPLKKIPEEVVTRGLHAAEKSKIISRQRGLVAKDRSGQPSGTYDPAGRIGEMFVAWKLNLPWGGLNNFKKGRDVGPYEVETTLPGRNLVVRQADVENGVPLDTSYILVFVEERSDGWYGRLMGQITLGDALSHPNKRRPHWAKSNEEVWLIAPQDLAEL